MRKQQIFVNLAMAVILLFTVLGGSSPTPHLPSARSPL